MPRATRAPGRPRKPRKAREGGSFDPLPPDAVLLTLDASSTAIGWSVWCGSNLRAAGVVACPKGWGAARRIRHNAWDAAGLVEEYGVDRVLVESQSHKSAGPKVQGLATLGKAQGYLMAVIEERFPGVVLEEVSERTWTAWGGKNMPKVKRTAIVASLVPAYAEAIRKHDRADEGMDCADAIGLALWRLGVIG